MASFFCQKTRVSGRPAPPPGERYWDQRRGWLGVFLMTWVIKFAGLENFTVGDTIFTRYGVKIRP